MHNSNAPEKETAAIRLYLDESGGDDPNTPHAVIGGMLIEGSRFETFENEWDAMLDDHGITPPLHMKEFGRPNGRFAKMSDCCRRELFLEAATLIDSHRIGTISASISNKEYQEILKTPIIGNTFSVYGMCFLLAAMITHRLAQVNLYDGKIPFILDSGNPYANHVRSAHASIVEIQRSGKSLHVGSLAFSEDQDFGILQASSRRYDCMGRSQACQQY